jgi:Ca-activated chloride channel family protein
MWRYRWNWKLVSVAAGIAAALLAGGGNSPAEAAGLLIAEGGLGGVLEIEEHTAQVTINNGVAVTEVTQVFRNTENRQVEALYLFPVPKEASVANFSMWIGGKEMVGEVVERKRAREIYNSYKQVRRDPGLLEQVDYKNFEMRIFPIGPNAEQRVQITYYQQLDFDHDWATYVYPLATAPRPGIDTSTKGRFGLTMHVKSEVPITKLESPSHADDFVIVPHGEKYFEASLETTGGDLGRDVVLAFHTARPHTGIDVITSKQRGEDGYFLLTLTAGEELAEAYTGMDYVFVLDVSGSMANDGKLGLSRGSIDAFINELGPEDRFEVITFNVAPNPLFSALQTVTPELQAQAAEFLRSQQARGGTVLRPAMATAYKYGDPDRPLNVVILSDGMTEQQERAELLAAIQARPANARVFCIGVGNDVNRPLLSQLADDAGGLAAIISQGDDFGRQAEAFRRKLLRPAAANVKITLEGADAYDIEPQQLPNLYHGMPVRMYGRYRKTGTATVKVSAEINGAPLEQAVAIDLPSSGDANPEIERMWAWHKVDRLLKEADRSGSRSAVIDEIVRLGEGYSIVTEYTSFLVLENDAEYQRWQIDRRNLLRVGRDRQQQQLVRNELQRLREQALADLGPAQTASGTDLQLAVNPQRDVTTAPTAPVSNSAPQPSGRDLEFRPTFQNGGGGGGIGGGAFDPITGGIALTLAGLGFAARRRLSRAGARKERV